MTIRNVALLALLLADVSANSPFGTYTAEITELGGSGVTGTAVVFAGNDGGFVGYGGFAEGLESGLQAELCTATNGCGVHIHTGFDCEDAAAQGGHYFEDPVMADPWVEARYSSAADGKASFSGVVDIGATDALDGRAFLVHAEDGSRVGCGLLTKVDGKELLSTETAPLADSEVTGAVTVTKLGTGVCFFGFSENLEPNLLSFLVDDTSTDCDAANGCGGHIHAGYSCENSTTQEGHFYNADTIAADPWKVAGYLSTDSDGMGYFTDCLEAGETDYDERAFVVHNSAGGRVSCGLLATAAVVPDDSGTSGKGEMMMNTLKLTTAFAMIIALAGGL